MLVACRIPLHPLAFATFLAFEKEDQKSRLVAFALMIAMTYVSLHAVFLDMPPKSMGTSVLAYHEKYSLSRLSILLL